MPTGAPSVAASLTLSVAAPSDVVLSPDGLKIYAAYDDGIVRVFSGETGAFLESFKVGRDLGALDVSPDGRSLFVVEDMIIGTNGKESHDRRTTITMYKVDPETGAKTSHHYVAEGYDRTFHDVAALSNGKVLLTQTFAGSGSVALKLFTPSTGRYTVLEDNYARYSVNGDSVLTRSLDGSRVLIGEAGTTDAPLWIYQAGKGLVAGHDMYDDGVSGPIGGVQALNGATGRVALHASDPFTYGQSRGGHSLYIFNDGLQYSGNLANKYPQWGVGVSGVQFSADGAFLFVLDNDADRIFQLSTATWTVVQSVPIGIDLLRSDAGGYGNHLLVSPDLRYFTVVSEKGLQRVDNPAVDEVIKGTAAGDRVIGTYWSELLYGLGGSDLLDGRGGTDTMIGGSGHDTYIVDNIDDLVVESGSSGNDLVRSFVDYRLPVHLEKLELVGTGNVDGRGNAGANTITGNSGANLINGGSGNDVIGAGAGDDRIYGSTGNDELSGGTGVDRFLFNTALGNDNVDDILDFYAPNDSIYLSRAVFTRIGPIGPLDPFVFREGSAAADGGDRIVYDQATGKIFYDADGSGAAAAILFATVTPGTPLTHADFIIYS